MPHAPQYKSQQIFDKAISENSEKLEFVLNHYIN